MIVVDFDHTLADGNSSRLLEEAVLAYSPARVRVWLWRLLFGPLKYLTQIHITLAAVVNGQRDLRLWYLMRFFRADVEQAGEQLFDQVSATLAARPAVLSFLQSAPRFTILSNGLSPIIERFVTTNHLKRGQIIASRCSVAPFTFILRGWRDKLSTLAHDEVEYLTDDYREVRFVQYALRRTFTVTASVWASDSTLYYLTITAK